MNMSQVILKEADILWKALATGAGLMLAYDVLRIFRRLIPHGNFWIAFEDVLFWTGSALVIFLMVQRENDGIIRGFVIGGVLLGTLLYLGIFSRFVVSGCVFVLEKVFYVLFRPFVCLGRLLMRPVRGLNRTKKKLNRLIRKQLKKLWKAVKIGICKL